MHMNNEDKMKNAIKSIHDICCFGSHLGLDRMTGLMKLLGNPQDELKFVHIAGSNGKGSAAAMLSSVLIAAGFKTGLYTSPHLVRYNERIKINGKDISDADYERAAETVCAKAAQMKDPPTEFEIITAMALFYFCEQNCDIVVLETGLGGRLDATNVISKAEVCMIMNIGLEHTEYLGDTIEKIAAEKAGIFKDGCTAVVYPAGRSVTEVYKEKIRGLKDAKLVVADFDDVKVSKITGTDTEIRTIGSDLSENEECELNDAQENNDCEKNRHNGNLFQLFDWQNLKNLKINLLGTYQLKNAAVVLETVCELEKRGFDIPENAIREGLEKAYWPARMEIVRNNPLFIIDGAHNPQCTEALAENLGTMLGGKKAIFIFGALKDKQFEKTIEIVKPFAKEFICLTPDSDRALRAEYTAEYINSLRIKEAGKYSDENADAAKNADESNAEIINTKTLEDTGTTNVEIKADTESIKARAFESTKEGMEAALKSAGDDGIIVSFGSLYLAGDVRESFYKIQKKRLREKCLNARKSLSPEQRKKYSETIVKNIVLSEEFKAAERILIYAPVGAEADITGLENLPEAYDKIFAYPVCIDAETMEAYVPGCGFHDSNKNVYWHIGKYNIQEPIPEKSTLMKPEDIDLVICPCAGFDEAGNRLGMGGGYYDRYLPECTKAKIAAAAFEVQKTEEIPEEAWDVRPEKVFTEKVFTKKGLVEHVSGRRKKSERQDK